MPQTDLCIAIKSQRLVRFFYNLDDEPGFRTVEPHMVARTKMEALALNGWYLSGATKSGQGPGWRTYLLSGISQVTVLSDSFDGSRDGYKSDGGKSFHDVQCGLS
jgi:hypothetical protein